MKYLLTGLIAVLLFMSTICSAQEPATKTTQKSTEETSQFTTENYNIDRDFSSPAPAKQPQPVNTAIQFSQKAQAAAAANDFNPAIEELSAIITATPNHVFALTNRANLYYKTKQADKALADAKTALQLNGKNHNAVFIAGSSLILMQQPKLAIRYFDTALMLKPGWLQALQYRGKLLVQTGQNAEAIADLTKVIEMEPKNAMSYLLRARAYYRKYMINESLMDYIAVTNMAPKESKLYEMAKHEFQMPLMEYEEREAFMKESAKKTASEVKPVINVKKEYFDKIHPLNTEAITLGMDVNAAKQNGYQSDLDRARKSLLANLNKQQELNAAVIKELKKTNNPHDKDMLQMLESTSETNNKMINHVKAMKVKVIEPSKPVYYDYDEYDYWN